MSLLPVTESLFIGQKKSASPEPLIQPRLDLTLVLDLRDFNKMAAAISQVNDQLLKAQDALFAHNAQLLTLQQEAFSTGEELRKLKEALAERGRYALFEIGTGVFVYRAKARPLAGAEGDPALTEPEHYVCQSCFDNGRKVVLTRQRYMGTGTVMHHCAVCKCSFREGPPGKPFDVRDLA